VAGKQEIFAFAAIFFAMDSNGRTVRKFFSKMRQNSEVMGHE
jgi:hypothetical protein